MFPGKRTMVLFVVIFTVFTGGMWESCAWALENSQLKKETHPREVVIKTEISADEKEMYLPETNYVDQYGNQFRLKRWNFEPYPIEKRIEHVKETVLYEKVEGLEQIPKRLSITTKDERTGQNIEADYPILTVQLNKEQWTSDFSFLAMFHSYDADYYQLGDKVISSNHEKPEFEGCETELLKEIGVTPDRYEITDAVWNGPPYMDKRGVICRKAVVTGRKKVGDYRVTYGGNAVFPKKQGYLCVSFYEGFDSATDGWKEVQEQDREMFRLGEESEREKGKWLIFSKTVVVTLSLLVVVVVFGFVIYLIKWLKFRRKKRE